jgi:hypothetical protein
MDIVMQRANLCRHTMIEITSGEDRLLFERCTFIARHIVVDAEIDRPYLSVVCFKGQISLGNLAHGGLRQIATGDRQRPRSLYRSFFMPKGPARASLETRRRQYSVPPPGFTDQAETPPPPARAERTIRPAPAFP